METRAPTKADLPPKSDDRRDPSSSIPHVGRSVPRVEDRALLTGRGAFLDDLPEPRGCLHAAILRSPHAHARLRAIDVSAARAAPGVAAVITGAEVKALTRPIAVGFKTPMDYRGIALDRVRYVGEPVAIVCARDRYRAEDALALIRASYEPLPAVVDPLDALAPDAPVLHEAVGRNSVSRRTFVHGDVAGAFSNAPHVTATTIRYPRNSITPMETYAMVCTHLADTDGYDVISNFQGPFSLHAVMALALRIPSSKLRHRSPANSGGSFGSKMTVYPYVVLMCVAARLTGRPVKWVEDRLEHLAAASSAPNRVTDIEAAHDGEGVVSALKIAHIDDQGAYLRAPMPAPLYRMHGLSTNGYRIGAVEVVNEVVLTNKCPTGAVRGFGGPQLYFATERLMHKIAVRLGLDPLEVIRRNLLDAKDFPYRTPAGALLDSGDYRAVIDDALDRGNHADLLGRREEARAEGRLYGIGYAAGVEPSQSNMGYLATLKPASERERAGRKDGAVSTATVSVDALGAVTVIGDSTPQGQGHATVLAQIVADELGLPIERIVVDLETDTRKDGWSLAAGNYSSRFAPAAASAAKLAAAKVRDKMARIASQDLNVPPDRITFANGKIHAVGNADNALDFARVGGTAHWSPSSLPDGMAPGLRETVHWSGAELTAATAEDEINASLAYGFVFDMCGVEIDPDTGAVRIDRYVTAHDAGVLLHPALADGQVRGSFAGAVGATLYEEFAYGPDGAFLSGTFADYLIGSADEIPRVTILHGVATPSPFTKTGAKGIGEGNSFTTPVAIANAVSDALGGREDVILPLTPARVFAWLHGEEERPPPTRAEVHDPAIDASLPAEHARTVATLAGPGALSGRGETIVPAPPDKVWEALLDPESLARIVPGCRSVERVSQTHYRAEARLGIGPVRGDFSADIHLSDLDPPNTATLDGALSGPLGAASGTGRIRLAPEAGGTRVDYAYDVHLSGTIASVGARFLPGAAKALIGQVFSALAKQAGTPDQPTIAAPAGRGGFFRRLLMRLGLIGQRDRAQEGGRR